eukprot:121294-Chlamydomonas_euryale.AAC.8
MQADQQAGLVRSLVCPQKRGQPGETPPKDATRHFRRRQRPHAAQGGALMVKAGSCGGVRMPKLWRSKPSAKRSPDGGTNGRTGCLIRGAALSRRCNTPAARVSGCTGCCKSCRAVQHTHQGRRT